jgi:hypothetical protein
MAKVKQVSKLTRVDGKTMKQLIRLYVESEVNYAIRMGFPSDQAEVGGPAKDLVSKSRKALYDFIGDLTGDNLNKFMGKKKES